MIVRMILQFFVFVFSAQVSVAETLLLGSIEAAKSYDYCAWVHDDKADSSLLPDVSAYIVKDTSTVDLEKLPSAIVIDAGMRVAKNAPDKRACEETFSAGRKLVSTIRKRSAKGLRRQAKFKKSKNKEIAVVQSEITILWMEDQLARAAYVQTQTASKTDARHWAHRISTADAVAIDEKSSKYLRELLSEVEWIDIHRFTRPISQHAWILVQHSDDHVDLQKLALSRMEPYLETGGVLKRNYAYLWDRVAVNSAELQRYGTQPDWVSCKDGKLALMPMEDPENVDERRSMMQLGPVQKDLEQMSRQTCI
ncbi:MAG: DUF6624 domain-containing protein [Woeseiaceae bacterium]